MTVVERIREQAARAPRQPALLVARRDAPAEADAVSYAELVARVDALAARLRSAGLREGERCGLLAAQGAGFVEGALAILAAGACMVPIPDDGSAAANAELARRARLHWIAAETGGFALRAGAVARPRRRRRRPRLPRAAPRVPALHLGDHRRAQGRDPRARGDRGAPRGRQPRARHRARGSRALAAADGASLRGVDPPLSPLRRRRPAAGGPPRAPGARARRARGGDAALRLAPPPPAARQGRLGAAASRAAPRDLDRRGPARADRRSLPRALRPAARAGARHHRGRPARHEPRARRREAGVPRPAAARLRGLAARRRWTADPGAGLAGADGRGLHPRPRPLRRLPRPLAAGARADGARRLPHRRPGLVRRRRRPAPRRPAPEPHQHGGHEVLQRGGRGRARRDARRAPQPRAGARAPASRRDSRRGARAGRPLRPARRAPRSSPGAGSACRPTRSRASSASSKRCR